jgi:uncharacterized protein involved in exopolysaccharide biosynthesis
MPAVGPQEVFFHLDFRRSLQMHRKLALGIFLATLLLSAGYLAKRWNTYKAQALVYVQPSPHKVIENGQSQQWPYDANTYESYIQQQVHDVLRPDVLAAAVKRIPGWQGSRESEQMAADRLGSAVEVTRVGTAYEVQIESTASSAEEAARIANAVASSYIDSATREQRAGDPQRIELLGGERDRILKELASDRSEQEDLSRKLGVAAASGTAADPIDDQIAQTRAELVKARTASDEAAAKLTALGVGKTSSAAIDAEADELVAADPGLVSMKTALNKRRSDLISQMANLTPNHPQYKQDAEELAKINASLETMSGELRTKAAAQIQQKLKNDLERTSSVESRLNGQLAQLTGAAGTAAPRMQRLNELGADVQRLQNRYAVVDEQYRNLTIENNSPGAVYLASAALPPLHAARAKVLRNVFIPIVAGLVLALGASLVAHNFDPRVYTARDVERVLGFAPMAQLPDLYEVGAGVTEEYMLRVAAAVEHARQQGLLTSCIFTGAGTGAGVTTVSSRVSNMLEAMGRQTVLVDAAGAPQGRSGDAPTTTDLVHAPRGSRSTALLQQMHEEAGDDSVVITDTAPLLVSGETEYLARFVDSAIVVIQSGVTTKAQLREVAQTLQRLEVSSVGFILNRISLKNANPAFLQSVRAVDSHLRSQARPLDPPAERPVPVREPVEGVPAVASQPLDFERRWDTASEQPETVQPQAGDPNQAPPQAAAEDRIEEIAEAPVPLPEIPGPIAAIADEPIEVAMEESEGPVALLEEVRETIEAHTAAVEPSPTVEAASMPTPKAVPVPDSVPVQESESARVPAREIVSRPLRGREPMRSTPAPDDTRTAGAAAPAESVSQPVRSSGDETVVELPAACVSTPVFIPASPAQRFEDLAASAAARISEFSETGHTAAIPPKACEAAPVAVVAESAVEERQPESETVFVLASREREPAEAASRAATRLGGLRTLMTSLGINHLHKETELRKTPLLEPIAERSEARPVERPVFAQPDTPAEPASQRADVPVREVIAQPEIIPPQAGIETTDREAPANRAVKSPHVSRWDIVDDVETLPSKRGQYRKRR